MAFRKKLYTTMKELQKGLNEWINAMTTTELIGARRAAVATVRPELVQINVLIFFR